MVGVDRLADYIRARPLVACSLCHPDAKHSRKTACCSVATWGPFHTASATPFPAHSATASRDWAMAAGCGLSTCGHWDGPGICNVQNPGGSSNSITVTENTDLWPGSEMT
jgi:hypothetical protein